MDLNDLFNHALTCLERGNLPEAEVHFRTVLSRNKSHVEAMRGLAMSLVDQARIAEAVELFHRAGSHSEGLFYGLHNAQRRAQHQHWGEQHQTKNIAPALQWDGLRPIRVGYVSPHLKRHTVTKFLLPVLKGHTAVQVFCYADVPKPDDVTEAVKALSFKWTDTTQMRSRQIANRIREDGIDVLVDLCGHMARGQRLDVFALRPAPIMVSYIGYPHATGLPDVHRITDYVADPDDGEELIVRLRRCCWAYQPDEDAPDVQALPATQTGYVTFGSMNRACKITDDVAATWAQVLHQVPKSKLVVLAHGGEQNTAIRQMLTFHGVPADRLKLIPQTPRQVFLGHGNRFDIHLDTWPYAGMTTTCDFLWQGVPTVTMATKDHVGRVGASLLTEVGLADLVATTPEDYVQIGVKLASDLTQLAELRHGLRGRMGKLLDGGAVAAELEEAFKKLLGGSNVHHGDFLPAAV